MTPVTGLRLLALIVATAIPAACIALIPLTGLLR